MKLLLLPVLAGRSLAENIAVKPLLPLSALCFSLFFAGPSFARAKNPACVEESGIPPEYCRFYVHYVSTNVPSDPRILRAMHMTEADHVRSIALVISVSEYPKLGISLPAAATDGERLQNFFSNDQRFDEVIALSGKDATRQNVELFLRELLPARGVTFGKNTRLVIALSVHGHVATVTSRAAFVFAGARRIGDSDGTMLMSQFAQLVDDLSETNGQVLTLINACYGGAVFKTSQGQMAPLNFTVPTSYTISAGESSEPVVSLDARNGSIFFDEFIRRVQSSSDVFAPTGRLGDIINTYGVFSFLVKRMAEINEDHPEGIGGIAELSSPVIGANFPSRSLKAGGPLFFLRPKAREASKSTIGL
ncbi:caspase family protein [Sphingomonas sp.]|uniref:caspase family protein n=1 Tax=Sphingomonas sp. TaxID=28214 RepID=UPI003CC5E3DD